jgi:hypothetical protein
MPQIAAPDAMSDLESAPSHIFISDLLKATPRMEGDRRFIYIEASNEKVDQQGEVVLAQALKDSADYFLQFGNLDIDHYTIIGARLGIPDYLSYEIGRPVACRFERGRTFVKGEIFQGETPMARRANDFWSSLVDLRPAQRWYPSVGGKCGPRTVEIDPKTLQRRGVVSSVRWYNIGFSKTPVNANVPEVTTMPMEVFAKSWSAAGLDFQLAKALTAGYGTDSATLAGGGALRKQSLDKKLHSYFDLRDSVSADMLAGRISNDVDLHGFLSYVSQTYGMDDDEASEFVERFARDIRDGIKKPVNH